MGLIIEVQTECEIGEFFKLAGLHEPYRFIETFHSNIKLWVQPDGLAEPFFKLTFGEIQGFKQVFDADSSDVVVD